MNHYRYILGHDSLNQLFLHLDGQGGTGKTHVIMYTSQELDRLAAQHEFALAARHGPALAEEQGSAAEDAPNVIVRAAPSGVAAFAISGKTVHSLFRFSPKSKHYEPLTTQNRAALQASFRGIKYLLVDEKSMLGLQQFAWINRRCQEIWPERADTPFGGFDVILCGDFFQLPPVAAKPLYSTADPPRVLPKPDDVQGRELYKLFNRTIILDVIMRQQGEDPTAIAFRTALNNLRSGGPTVEDWRLLSSRIQANLPPTEIAQFKDAIRLYATKDEVRQLNHSRLRELGVPVIVIKDSHEGRGADKASTEDAGNLQAKFAVAIGARVMLTQNVWTERGLVNGAIGTVHDIIWEIDVENPREQPPLALLVHFDKYDGPALCETEGMKLVPIFRLATEWSNGSVFCRRTQFPMVLAYAITIHKSQGLTVNKAVLRIGSRKDFAPGLTYVGISRVKSLHGLIFEEAFDLERLRMVPSRTTAMREEDCLRRQQQQVQSP
ncbi:hypothetical protein Egran_05597, partial [Elaphomyces granulatus]